ncbi:helix-turn-helix domain-containing protein [Catenulispora rubra]|uniref:helix-turn-helix domain-containing protein n=1 Tax=Catenulispora rubra TaxID=280293 RepID=UPI0018922ABA|nr:helix-turn-helix domain-containing protein [Catenulispora rubra]
MSTLTAASAEEWAQICSDSFAPCGIDSVASDFRGTVDTTVYSPTTAMARLVSKPMDVLRSRQHVSGAPRSDYMLVLHQRGGAGLVEQDGRSAEVPAGQAVLWDASRPYRFRWPTPVGQTVLKVSHEEVGHWFGDASKMCLRPLPMADPTLRVLSAFLRELAEVEDELHDPLQRAELAHTAGELLATALRSASGAAAPQAAGREALLLMMRAFISENLADPALGPGTIADRHHVSVRYVTSLFRDLGTSPAAYIREQRVERARQSLGDPRRRESGVAAVAASCGFTDTTTFTRAFRRAYGVTPTEFRSAGRAA